MLKNKDIKNINLNILIFVFILYLFKDNLVSIILKLIKGITPVVIAFTISYIVYPLYKKLNKKYNKFISITIIYTSIFAITAFIIYSIIPNSNILQDTFNIFNDIMKFLFKINEKYNLNIENIVMDKINIFIRDILSILTNIVNTVINLTLILILSLYILIDFDNIKEKIKLIFKKRLKLLYEINNNIKNYINSLFKILLIQIIEYTIIYFIIGHPYFLLLGTLNSITYFIPIVGPLFTNVLAIITASIYSRKLLILTSIMVLILPNIDAYLIAPKIYKEKIKLSPVVSILAISVGGSLFGIKGIILFIPITLIIMSIWDYKKKYKN